MKKERNNAGHEGFFRYLVVPASERVWGLWVTGVGFTLIGPGSSYPPLQHPSGYQFEWSQGRILQEYQVIYLSRGTGTFEDADTGIRKISAGDCFLLRPGIWHRYRPDPECGWDEHWFSCCGPVGEKILSKSFLSAQNAVLSLGLDPRLIDAFGEMVQLATDLPAGHCGDLAAISYRIIARLRSRSITPQATSDGDLIRQAVCRLHANLTHPISIPKLAQELGVNYETLRKVFREQTGQSPKHYLQTLRMRHAQDLLSSSNATLGNIAERLGFGSAEHLSRLFSRYLGLSPGRWRNDKKQNSMES